MSTLDDAIQLIRMGNQDEGRQILEELLEEDEANEQVWLWLSAVVDSDEDREVCLDNVLALDPDNTVAQRGLEALRSGTFNVTDLLADALGEDIQEEDEEPITFLDDFVVSDDDDDLDFDDDDESPSKKKGGLNVRFIILAVLVLVLVIVLGGLAFASLSLMGGDDGGEEGPVDEQPEIEPTPEDTPTPSPTETPTQTPTSELQLPTKEPTPEPSPTATTVVSPTPSN